MDHTPSIKTSVAVPVLQAVAIGAAIGVLVGGLALLFDAAWLLAGKVAAAGLLVGTSGTVVLFVFQERSIRATPALVARQQLAPPPALPPEQDAEPWRVIRPYRPRPTLASATVEHRVQAIEPDAPAHIRQLHQFVCDCWDGGTGSLSRDACRKHGYTRRDWERWVGGKRGAAGESGRGILDRAGVVERTSTGWQWADGVTLQDVFSVSPELLEYASARARLVSGRRDRTSGTGQDRHVTTSGRPGRQ